MQASRRVGYFNRYAVCLLLLAWLLNGLFFFYHNPKVYFAITQAHGQVGYHIWRGFPPKLNASLTAHLNQQMSMHGQLVPLDTIRDIDVGKPQEPFLINDTIGYGLLLGCIWKLTNSLQFVDVQVLQMIIYSLLMLLLFQLFYLLFASTQIAFFVCLAHLMFFPLLAYNVMPVRDVWAYYGLVMLCYGFIAYASKHIDLLGAISCFMGVAVCLWMRPTLMFAVLLLSILMLAYAYMHATYKKRIVKALLLCALAIMTLFWWPFVHYNMCHYGRWIVGPAGQSMLEGLGEIENPWGHELNDEYVQRYIHQHYGLKYGTPAFDNAAMQEFYKALHEHPWHYIKTLIYRIPDAIVPGLQWIFYERSPYADCVGIWQKLHYAFSSPMRCLDFFLRHILMRIYILCAYVGLVLLWRKRYRFISAFVLCILLSGLSTYPSHIEYRYLVPFYWILAVPVGFLWHQVASKQVLKLFRRSKVTS